MLTRLKNQYQTTQKNLIADFKKGSDVRTLMAKRTTTIDQLLVQVWQHFIASDDLCLVAVGGYGRAELCLYSDIDLLILLPEGSHQDHQQSLSDFLTFLWDIGLEVGHSTRDINDCTQAVQDLTTLTNLLEARHLFGNKSLFSALQAVIKNSTWQSQSFLIAKQEELKNRHHQYQDTAYSLEPNIKESPGGLRDIQTLLWVTKWHFNMADLSGLLAQGFLQQNEYDILSTQQKTLWYLRFGLHSLMHKKEDKIGFSEQKKLANLLGFVDKDTMAVEQLMKTYYKCVAEISQVSDILLQSLENLILHTQPIDDYFAIKEGYLKANIPQVFQADRANLLRLFLYCTKYSYIQGIHTELLRELLGSLYLIDEDFREDKTFADIFLNILKAKQGVSLALNLMSRYGVLARYIPMFAKIVGLMQYDLFHRFTVDQHILFVIANLVQFFSDKCASKFGLCYEIAKGLPKPELLILAGLFHDIAKGRGGDHSELGSLDAQEFCEQIGLNQYDIALVSWLVKQHLLMSSTAQKHDLSDPEVIANFANIVGNQVRLQYLYLLTVADICATNKELWNDWKDALLKQLYYASNHLFRHGLDSSKSQVEIIEKTQSTVRDKLVKSGYEMSQVQQFYKTLPSDYFLRYTPDEILWHHELITHQQGEQSSIIGFNIQQQGRLDLFIYSDDKPCVFLTMVLVLERLSLFILSAKVISSHQGKTLNTISVEHTTLLDLGELKAKLLVALNNKDNTLQTTKHRTRRHQHFEQESTVNISQHVQGLYSILEVKTLDKQGVLSNIVHILCTQHCFLLSAKVASFGERVEDIFFIVNQKNKALNPSQAQSLKQQLINAL